MIEHIKTTTLWFLILLSIFLTFQIWTFQPNYATLKSTEYIANAHIGDEKKLQEVIRPKHIVINQEDLVFSPINNKAFLEQFYEKYLGFSLERFTLTPNLRTFNRNIKEYKIEFVFPTSIPVEALKDIFQISSSDQFFISNIDRIIFYVVKEQEQEQVHVKLISDEAKLVVDGQTNISLSQFKEDFNTINLENFYEVFPYDITHYGNGFKKTVYLPVEAHFLDSVTYLAKPISTELFKQLLFSDPNFVKQYVQSNGEESFTDGNRMVNILHSGNVLKYINPTFGDMIERTGKHVLFSAFDFLNAHGGLTNSFYFDSKKSLGTTDEVTFRLSIDDIPVYRANLSDVNNLFEITLQRGVGHQIEQYVRPLFFVEEEPINITKSTKLPSGKLLIEALNARENLDPYLLTDITYGYFMIKRQSFVLFEPRWFIEYDGAWEFVHVVDDEGDSEAINSGLE
ncbi:MAG: YycH family regulatory protein [Anaerobacillus sp.]|uniref:YycH family regulatory protein n=1 Tax=Anaerobacillus sp. TaxID=1872506 RepID=UPI0039192F94